jgi:ssDNA-binding replication factor A large subunit
MSSAKDRYEQVKDLLSHDQFERRIQDEIEAWDGLLSGEAAALLVVDALGRNEIAFGQVRDLYEGGEALLQVQVRQIGSVRTFARRDEQEGRVVQLQVTDDSGDVRLDLLDEEVDLVTSGTVREGGRIRLVDGYVRQGREGLVVTTGKWGVVLPEAPDESAEASGSQFRF